MLHLPVAGEMPSLAGGVEWLNSLPLTSSGLRGKVVLVDFWTFTCVNWLRTLPYVRAWYETYKNRGFTVVGVHTPEFGFEKEIDNVRHAVRERKIGYPVVTDPNYAIWNAFNNQYWPAIYLADAHGRIRYHHFGEGAYEEAERAIEELLSEAGHPAGQGIVSVHPSGLEVAADWNDVDSPENFLGYERTVGFASPGGFSRNTSTVYRFPHQLQRNEWALSGDWTAGSESVRLDRPKGRIAYRFHARDVNLIMSAPQDGKPVSFRVFLDGRPPESAHGDDADANGKGSVARAQTYQLIRQHKPIVDRQFEIEFSEPGVAAYDFTFG